MAWKNMCHRPAKQFHSSGSETELIKATLIRSPQAKALPWPSPSIICSPKIPPTFHNMELYKKDQNKIKLIANRIYLDADHTVYSTISEKWIHLQYNTELTDATI